MVNKKIIGATPVIIDNIKYRSKFESRCAQILKENNILFEYEPFRIDNKYILEIKGYANDVYRYKKKLVLLKLLQDNKYDFIEIRTLTELKKWIQEYKS